MPSLRSFETALLLLTSVLPVGKTSNCMGAPSLSQTLWGQMQVRTPGFQKDDTAHLLDATHHPQHLSLEKCVEHSHDVGEKIQTVNYLPSAQLSFCDQMSLHKTKGKKFNFQTWVCVFWFFGFICVLFCFWFWCIQNGGLGTVALHLSSQIILRRT